MVSRFDLLFLKFGSSFGSMPLAKKVEIALRSVIWVPFENGKMNKSNIALELNGGVGPNPFGDMVFAEMYEFLEDLVCVKIIFYCYFRGQIIYSPTERNYK